MENIILIGKRTYRVTHRGVKKKSLSVIFSCMSRETLWVSVPVLAKNLRTVIMLNDPDPGSLLVCLSHPACSLWSLVPGKIPSCSFSLPPSASYVASYSAPYATCWLLINLPSEIWFWPPGKCPELQNYFSLFLSAVPKVFAVLSSEVSQGANPTVSHVSQRFLRKKLVHLLSVFPFQFSLSP